MQLEIKNKFRIPISIGISHNKFIAKMTTGLAKPFGIMYTKFNDIPTRIWPLDISEYFGIGKSTAQKLIDIGITTIGKLASSNKFDHDLFNIWRSQTSFFINQARGISSDNLNYEHNDLKSISNELTFMSIDLDERDQIYKIIYNLCQKVALRAYNRNALGYVISVSVRSTNRVWTRKQITLDYPTNDLNFIYEKARILFNQLFDEEYIRGVGVKLSRLVNEFEISKKISLFEDEKIDNSNKLKNIIQNINSKMKKKLLKLVMNLLEIKLRKTFKIDILVKIWRRGKNENSFVWR